MSLFHFVLLILTLSTAPTYAAETADPSGVQTITTDKSPSAISEGVAQCNRDYAEHKCADLKASLPKDKADNIKDCSIPETYVPAKIALGIGQGVGAFVYDTAKAVVYLPYNLSKVPGAIASSIKEEDRCFNDTEYKKNLLEPIKGFQEAGSTDAMTRWSCNQIRQYVEQVAQRKVSKIGQKKLDQQKYDEMIKANPSKEAKDFADLAYPKDKRELTEEEKKFEQNAAYRKRAEGALPDIIKKVKQSHACYTNQYQAKVISEIATGIVVPGAAAKLLLDPRARLLLSDFSKNGRFTAASDAATSAPASKAVRIADEAAEIKPQAQAATAAAERTAVAERAAVEEARVSKASETLGRELTEKEKDAVIKAHKVGDDELGKSGRPAEKGDYTQSQVKEKAEILKGAGFDTAERRTLLEQGIAGRERAPPFSAKSLDEVSLGDKVAVPRTGGGYSNGEVVKLDPKTGQAIVRFDDGTGIGRNADVRNLRSPIAAGDDIAAPTKGGSYSNGKVTAVHPDGKVSVRFADDEVAKVPIESLRGGNAAPRAKISAGDDVSIPRSDGSYSKGKVTATHPDGTASVQFPVGAQVATKRVPIESLRGINGPVGAPRGPPVAAPAAIREQAIAKYEKEIDRIAPLSAYTSNGYWRQWRGVPTNDLPQQGWKLHVGAKPETASDIAKVLAPELEKQKIPFKIVDDLERFARMDPATNTQAGKFITVYPRTAEEAKVISQKISEILRERGFQPGDFLNAPGEGRAGLGVNYRYGRIVGGELRDGAGRVIPGSGSMLRRPDGRLVPDERGIIAPSWVVSPFKH